MRDAAKTSGGSFLEANLEKLASQGFPDGIYWPSSESGAGAQEYRARRSTGAQEYRGAGLQGEE
ncbi:hypothetical protein GCM10009839_74040 [Catenulispora yoronensis]|uniref:Uncharacterized protein n=1 Tax=Catenulispora yoronensis TaxID=450799 RepID=A0ABN2V838_9ACTN